MTQERYAVFGHPVAHSLSPRIHALFARQAGMSAPATSAIDAAPAEFAAALAEFRRGRRPRRQPDPAAQASRAGAVRAR